MNDRIEQPRDYVIRSTGRSHRAQPTRYEQVRAAIEKALFVGAVGLGLWMLVSTMLNNARAADRQITNAGPVCVNYSTQHVSCE